MAIYSTIYHNICQSGRSRAADYCRGSGLHRHRITPGHSGGEYTEENVTYLTVREHVAAHFLLWKMHRDPNDLRSMYMLGANLTPSHRRVVGLWCAENKRGIHGWSFEKKSRHGKRGYLNKKNLYQDAPTEKSFYFWSTPEGRKKRASMGGKATWEIVKVERGLPMMQSLDPEVRKLNSMRANKIQPKKPVTDGIICKKFHTEEEREAFIEENPAFRKGVAPRKRKSTEPKKWMFDPHHQVCKQVKLSNIEDMLESGWVMGRGPFRKPSS